MATPWAHELLHLGSRTILLSMIDCHWYLLDTDGFAEDETENICVASTEQLSFYIDMITLKNLFSLWSLVQQVIVGAITKELACGNIPVLKELRTVETKS